MPDYGREGQVTKKAKCALWIARAEQAITGAMLLVWLVMAVAAKDAVTAVAVFGLLVMVLPMMRGITEEVANDG